MTNIFCKMLSLYLVLLLPTTVFAQGNILPKQNPVPGGIAIVELGKSYQQQPLAHMGKQRLLVTKNNNQWVAVVGIPLSTKPGKKKITVQAQNGKTSSHYFQVQNKDYETRHITISNKRMVSPTKKDIERHYKEKPLIIAALKNWTESSAVETNFKLPVKGRFSSPFGLKRIYNKQKRIRRHTGLDIAAPTGTYIFSPARGVIIRTGNYFFTGNTVFIDHGQGLISMYCHLNQVSVKAGDRVKQNELIGQVGMTGRVSGPHLHWVVSLNNTKVDPALFLNQ